MAYSLSELQIMRQIVIPYWKLRLRDHMKQWVIVLWFRNMSYKALTHTAYAPS